MNAALTPSRRKICSKVRRTDVVPAPEEPVTEMIGCLTDMPSTSPERTHLPVRSPVAQQAAPAEERRALAQVRLAVQALDVDDLRARADHDRHPPVQIVRQEVEDAPLAGGGAAAGLLDHQGDRIGLVQQPETAVLIPRPAVAGI